MEFNISVILSTVDSYVGTRHSSEPRVLNRIVPCKSKVPYRKENTTLVRCKDELVSVV